MQRNQVVLGLSKAVVVIEAGATGGTMRAGQAALKLKIPLHVVEYEDMAAQAPGNGILLGAGGVSVRRRKSGGRANVEDILRAVSGDAQACGLRQLGLRGTGAAH